MIVTRATDYAIHILLYLGMRAGGDSSGAARATRQEIVEGTHVPAAFLNKIVQKLAKANLVAARPGVQGGCSLACAAKEITVLRVIEAIEGPVQLSECLGEPSPCRRAPLCSFRGLLQQLQDEVLRVLRSETIAGLAAEDGQAANCLQGLLPACTENTGVCGTKNLLIEPKKIE